jgi:xanthine dehydrogenase YagS FAD-binding subunit
MSTAPFAYDSPTSLAAALAALERPGAAAVGGGTDLVPRIDEGLAAPAQLVDVRRIPGAREVTALPDGGLRIGAAVRIADLAKHPVIVARFPLLAAAAGSVGTPALRNMGTLAGNLLQRPHCWYYRRAMTCFKNGGTSCLAVSGEHQYHGIVAAGTCRSVHVSDPATALLALDAVVEVAWVGGGHSIPLEALYEGAAANPAAEAVLGPGELITAILLPAAAALGVQHWEKLMQRGAFDFALVSCAAARRADGSVRLALGGVAAAPWRIALSVEEDVASGGLDAESLDALAERALYDTEPLERNGYKVTMARALLVRAMRALSA